MSGVVGWRSRTDFSVEELKRPILVLGGLGGGEGGCGWGLVGGIDGDECLLQLGSRWNWWIVCLTSMKKEARGRGGKSCVVRFPLER